MKLSTKISVLALALGATMNQAAFAAGDVWDSLNPWGDSTLTEFAGWNVFDLYPTDNTPEVAGSGVASLTETTGAAFLTGGGNIYSFAAPTNFIATLAGSEGLFDVYLRIATVGNLALPTASLNGISATSVIAFDGASGNPMGGGEQELYWKWSNFTGASTYTFNFGAADSSMSLDQLSLATVAVAAVPEPSTYGMFVAGLGMMGFVARRRSKK
jgi:hypothetical protein